MQQIPEHVHEAAQQILVSVSDIHDVLALEGRQDLMGALINIQKTAAGIMKMDQPELELDVREAARQNMMRAIGSLGHAINRNLAEWPNFNGEEVVLIIQLAECCVKRGQAWMDMVVKAEEAEDGPQALLDAVFPEYLEGREGGGE